MGSYGTTASAVPISLLGGLIRASRGIFYLPALLPPPPATRLSPLSSVPSGAEGGSECVRRRAAQDSTAEGRGFSFVDQPDATDQQNKPPCSVCMKPRKIEKYFAGDLSPLSERKGSMLTNRQ